MKKITSILLCLALALSLCVPALADGFNAGVTVSEVENDSFTVTVPTSNDTILAAQKPTLTVPCPDAWENAKVELDSVELKSTFADHAVSFTVAVGGAYTITKTDKADNGEGNNGGNETPSNPITPSTPASETKTTATTNEDGSIAATISASDAADGKVCLPIEVKSAEKAEDAPKISISVPASAGKVKVEIPVEDISASDVVVLVHADGTEEILPKTALTESGVAIETEESVTVKVVSNEQEFKDVAENYWGNNAIEFVAARGLFRGVGDEKFMPEGIMNRAMLATVLYRMESEPESKTQNLFGDVAEGEWYSEAVVWGNANGIIEGYGRSFGVNDPVTREQLAVMLWRLAGKPDAETVESGASSWAEEAMSWAVSAGLIRGGDNGYNPKGSATRAEIAAILMRYINL